MTYVLYYLRPDRRCIRLHSFAPKSVSPPGPHSGPSFPLLLRLKSG